MISGCICFNKIKYQKEYLRLAENEIRVTNSVRKNDKKLFIVSESTGIKKQAIITKLDNFGISAVRKFKGNEIGERPFIMRLEEENGNLVYRRIFDVEVNHMDTIDITWTLETGHKDKSKNTESIIDEQNYAIVIPTT